MESSGPVRSMRRRNRVQLWLAGLFSAVLLACGRAEAGCIDLPFPDLQALAALDLTNASQAAAGARSMIALARRDPTTTPLRLAALYAVAAQSNSILELD